MVERRRPLIVEIGPGGIPIFVSSERVGWDRVIMQRARYIGIDSDSKGVVHESDGVAVSFGRVGDFIDSSLLGNDADELWVMNVFNDPVNHQKFAPVERADGTVWNDALFAYMQEMVRITRVGGQIFIGEYYRGVHDNLRLLSQITEELGLERDVYTGDRVQEFLTVHRTNEIIGDQVAASIALGIPVFFMTLTKR